MPIRGRIPGREPAAAAGGDGYPCLNFFAGEAGISRFFPLLQQGVLIRARVGRSVSGFLREEIVVGQDTMEKIQSVFLDGRPVDDLDSSIIKDGACLALSAAMPGLVGATLRRGGAYASFRSTITHRDAGPHVVAGDGFVQIKLFNLLMDELGPELLRKGIFIKTADLAGFLKGQSPDFWEGFSQILLDGEPAGSELAKDNARLSEHGLICLSVTSAHDHRTGR